MDIQYYLIQNPETNAPDDYRAQVTHCETASENQIIEHITQIRSGITTKEATDIYHAVIKAHEHFLRQGYEINTDFVHARPAIIGTFRGKNDAFDSSRHQVKFQTKLENDFLPTGTEIRMVKKRPVDTTRLMDSLEELLSEQKIMRLQELKEHKNLPETERYMAIGWLACEGKILLMLDPEEGWKIMLNSLVDS